MSGIVGGINLRSSGLVNISSATDGQVFTGTGAGLPVGFEDAGGSAGLNFISRVAISSSTATADFLSSFSSTYDNYMATWDFCQPVDDGEPFVMNIAQGGSVVVSSSHDRAMLIGTEGSSVVAGGGAGHDHVYLTAANVGNASLEEHTSGHVWIWSALHAAPSGISWQTYQVNESADTQVVCGSSAFKANDTALSGIQFRYECGNILIGNFTLYGLAKA